MRSALRYVFLTILNIIICQNLIIAEIAVNNKVYIDGNIRYRFEIDGKDFNDNTGMYDYALMRTQFGIRVLAEDNLIFRIKFKDSRYLGTTGSNKKSTSFVDMQEAYILVKEIFNSRVDLQLGRYEFLYGRRRILGNGGWNNFGPRTYDGFRMIWNNTSSKIEFVYAEIVERSFENQIPYTNDSVDSRDRSLFALSGVFLNKRIHPLLVIDWDNRSGLQEADLIMTSAVYARSRTRRLNFDLDAGYQFGKKSDNDLSSWLLAADIKYIFKGKSGMWLGAGADIASGNDSDDLQNGEDHVFYTPFMSRHAFKGFMDYYQDVEPGLIDLVFRAGLTPFNDTEIQLDFHSFSSMKSMQNGGGENYKLMGQEIDLRLKRRIGENLEIDTAASTYFPTEDWVPNGDPAYFYYLSVTGKF